MEKWRLKLTSAKVEVEVEAELGNFFIWLISSTWSDTMFSEVRRMGSSLNRQDFSELIRHLIQRVAVVLARVNATMILYRKFLYALSQVGRVE